MKKLFFIILVNIIAISSNSFAREKIQITCIPELNYFEAEALTVNSSGKLKQTTQAGINILKDKYNLIDYTDKNTHTCKLENNTLKYQFIFDHNENDSPNTPISALIKVWVNDHLVLNLENFGSGSDHYNYPNSIIYEERPNFSSFKKRCSKEEMIKGCENIYNNYAQINIGSNRSANCLQSIKNGYKKIDRSILLNLPACKIYKINKPYNKDIRKLLQNHGVTFKEVE